MEWPRDEKYTYADYAAWDTDARYELIDGVPCLMAPAPSIAHQEISGALFSQLYACLKGKPCKVFHAPFDVRLNPDGADDTVVQPDLTVVCDRAKLENGQSCKGAPDMVIEILSPATAQRDQVTKFNKYRQAGVLEYWIVSPQARTVQAYRLKNGEYAARNYDDTATIPVAILDGLPIDLSEVFPPLPQETAEPGPD